MRIIYYFTPECFHNSILWENLLIHFIFYMCFLLWWEYKPIYVFLWTMNCFVEIILWVDEAIVIIVYNLFEGYLTIVIIVYNLVECYLTIVIIVYNMRGSISHMWSLSITWLNAIWSLSQFVLKICLFLSCISSEMPYSGWSQKCLQNDIYLENCHYFFSFFFPTMHFFPDPLH